MATISLPKIMAKAQKLYELRKIISSLEEELKVELDAFRTERDALQLELIADLSKAKLQSIKVEGGETYVKAVRKGVAITNELSAFKWALDNKAVKIDTVLAGQIIKEMKEVPAGFEKVETEYISVRKEKE